MIFRYRKNKNSGETDECAKTHPLSILARSANMFLKKSINCLFPVQFHKRKYLLLDSRLCGNDASLYYETTASIRGRRVDRYAGTFFICWGDETLNMIVRYFRKIRIELAREVVLAC
uniref:Uncharacterized protein n=1 Tax=Candidatus Kentrum sp. LPFa TaxID=2126335 RepID=A0A450XG43_9GAMM|nr:MAG: hypothetical protein BECKLPF1236A_GA0070988_100065 [Candidatus Kentron sp. LPFa]VFK28251.1 MAG: hypothetical protein BECKLPF1236C_GA0070990_100629 [Candidatus Kentron sp. LPFa]